jgi:hypothetical protein
MGIGAFGFLLLAVLVGFDRGGSPYMHPFFLPTVLLFAALAKHQMRGRGQVHAYFLVLLAAFICIAGLRFLELFVGPPMCGSCEIWENFEPLARALETVGRRDGMILTTDRVTAGNLRQLLPTIPVFIVERRKLTPQHPKVDVAIRSIAIVTRTDQYDAKQALDVFCQAQGKTGSSSMPANTFSVVADWRRSHWKPSWHPKSVWYVSIYSPAEFCSLDAATWPTKLEQDFPF